MDVNQECCGVVRNSPYCPMCGRKLIINPLAELLGYLGDRLKTAQTQLRHTKQGHNAIGNADAKKANVERYERWIRAIQDVMKEKEGR